MRWAFSIRFKKAECLIVRLSFFEFMKESEIMAPGRWVGGGRAIMPEPVWEVLVVLLRMEGRFLGAVGACVDC